MLTVQYLILKYILWEDIILCSLLLIEICNLVYIPLDLVLLCIYNHIHINLSSAFTQILDINLDHPKVYMAT